MELPNDIPKSTYSSRLVGPAVTSRRTRMRAHYSPNHRFPTDPRMSTWLGLSRAERGQTLCVCIRCLWAPHECPRALKTVCRAFEVCCRYKHEIHASSPLSGSEHRAECDCDLTSDSARLQVIWIESTRRAFKRAQRGVLATSPLGLSATHWSQAAPGQMKQPKHAV